MNQQNRTIPSLSVPTSVGSATADRGSTRGPMELAVSETIYEQGSRASSFFKVEGGIVRIYRLLPSGKRHIVSFRSPGEWFGLSPGRYRDEFAEAASDVQLKVYPLGTGHGLSEVLLHQVLSEIAKAHSRQILLTEKDPVRRLASFVEEWVDRDAGKCDVEIPIPRRDVADYLGLTIETVARCFTKLRRDGVLQLSGKLRRSVHILDPKALSALSSSNSL